MEDEGSNRQKNRRKKTTERCVGRTGATGGVDDEAIGATGTSGRSDNPVRKEKQGGNKRRGKETAMHHAKDSPLGTDSSGAQNYNNSHSHRKGRHGNESGGHNRNDNRGASAGNRSGGARANYGNNKKRQVFEPYWTEEAVSHGLKRGQLFQGALRINPKNFEDGYVPHPDGISDVYISGTRDRNRSLNGDIVAVLINPRDQWKVCTLLQQVLMEDLEYDTNVSKKLHKLMATQTVKEPKVSVTEQLEKLDLTQHNSPGAQHQAASAQTPKGSHSAQKRRPSGKTNTCTPKMRYTSLRGLCSGPDSDDVDEVKKKLFNEGDENAAEYNEDANIKERMDLIPDRLLLRTGKVVFIIEKKHCRASSGHIKLMQDRNPNRAIFAATDHRFPRLFIPMTDCPKDFLERENDHKNTLYIGRLTAWEADSAYPMGCLARSLGEAGEIEPETEGILMENDVDFSEFPDQALACLPQNLPWSIPQEEYQYRKDLRKECIFTIDPATARDLDDALHCVKLPDGMYEVGVHIADVSFFVKEKTFLDEVAGSRATSVYLVQKVIPMLPRLLCEELCSLNPDCDRLAFSVIWKMTEEGEIQEEWFGRSVIRSCAKLSYQHAQGFIEEPNKEWAADELPPISKGFSVQMIVERVLNLFKISKNLRKKRFDQGALRLDQVKLVFALDKDTGLPCGHSVYEQKDSNRLIEEFMLLANMAVAHKIYKAFPEVAMLRRHPSPQVKQLDDLISRLKALGIHLDGSSAGAINSSLARYIGDSVSEQARMQILTVLASKPMQNARYFCTGCFEEEIMYRHYALNVPLYTHFTSPIRRYPDIVVHRLLAAALGMCEVTSAPSKEVQQKAEHCNDKKLASKRAQEMSSDLFFSVFVKECGPLEEKGMVMGVLDKSFDVLVMSLGVVKRVYVEQLKLEEHSFRKDHNNPELTLVWKQDDVHPNPVQQVLTIFSEVNCRLLADPEAGTLKWKAVIKHPDS